jgi:Amidohydrolase family
MRIGTLVDEGIVVSLHADTPVAPPRPLEEVWIAVNRIGALLGEVRGPGERVSVDKALRMITIDAAYTLGVDDKAGSIETGKLADFTVLDADPREVRAHGHQRRSRDRHHPWRPGYHDLRHPQAITLQQDRIAPRGYARGLAAGGAASLV